MLGVFNLLPVPPLDGSKVVGSLLPDALYHRYMAAGRFGIPILLIAMFTGLTRYVILPIIEGIFGTLLELGFIIFG